MRLAMMIELDHCVGCLACVSACKERWDSGPGAARDWVRTFEHGKRGEDLGITFYPGLCMHCTSHPCTADCPTGATYARPDGTVVVDRDLCIGCGTCIPMCPYGARHVDDTKRIVEKCNFCTPYMAKGEAPACVETCLSACRHFGDLEDPNSAVSQIIKERGAEPLVTSEVNVGPNVYYAPAKHRQELLRAGVVRTPNVPQLTDLWQGIARPFARMGVPAFALLATLGGLVINLRSRGARAHNPGTQGEKGTPAARETATLDRHSLGMRVLHWFNAASWLLLITTGTALLVNPSYALFGVDGPRAVARIFGGGAGLLRFHAGWGILWAAVIVPFFLVFKKGGIDALREIRMTRDDMRWLALKPLVALGISSKELPPQDKYNAGQKVFAASALMGTSLIIASGLIMTFHLGNEALVAAMIVVHKFAIALALMGLSVHITMAALVREERPALASMFTGKVSREHAATHASKWVSEVEQEQKSQADGPGSREHG